MFICALGFPLSHLITLVYRIGCRGEHTTIRVSPASVEGIVLMFTRNCHNLSSLFSPLCLVIRSFYTVPRLQYYFLNANCPTSRHATLKLCCLRDILAVSGGVLYKLNSLPESVGLVENSNKLLSEFKICLE